MFALRLKGLRKEHDMTQVQLANALGVSTGTVAMWETGRREPGFDMVNQLTKIFDKRMDYILGYSNDSSSVKRSDTGGERPEVWELESRIHDIFLSYLALDDYGKNAVENLIHSEKLRCHEQQTLCDTDGIKLEVSVDKC